MFIEFEKWHGCKNDFIVVHSASDDDLLFYALKKKSKELCARDGSGIGADGILFLAPKSSSETDIPNSIKIINSDSSIASMCGNGSRCAVASIEKKFIQNYPQKKFPDIFELHSESRILRCSKMDKQYVIDMGQSQVLPKSNDARHQEVKLYSEQNGLSNVLNHFYFVHLENQHLVFFVENLDQEKFLSFGKKLQESSMWNGINVHFVHVQGDILKTIVWERGAGATQACGSGACAVASASIQEGIFGASDWIQVEMPGGILKIKCEPNNSESSPADAAFDVRLSGPTKFIFRGTLEI